MPSKRDGVCASESETANAVIHYAKALFCTHSLCAQSKKCMYSHTLYSRLVLVVLVLLGERRREDEVVKKRCRFEFQFDSLSSGKINTIKIIFIPHKILLWLHSFCTWCRTSMFETYIHAVWLRTAASTLDSTLDVVNGMQHNNVGQAIIICIDMVRISETHEHFWIELNEMTAI